MFRPLVPAVSLVIAMAACSDSPAALTASASDNTARLLARGEQLAYDLCGQCHGPDFEGVALGAAACPGLGTLRSYTLPEFNRLLVSGKARDGSIIDEPMRSITALGDDDREALFRYFTSRLNYP